MCLLSRRTFGAGSKEGEAISQKRLPWQRPTSTPLDSPYPDLSKLCVTPLKWNSSQHSWANIHHRLQDTFSTNLKGQIDQLQLELHQQLGDIKRLTEQKLFQTIHDNLQWLNPKNWFDGLNLQVWVMAALVCVLVLILICALRCIWKLFSRGRVQKQQIVGFTGLTTTTDFTNKKGGDVGNRPAWFQRL